MYRRDTWKDGTYHWSLRYCPDCWLVLDEVEAVTQPSYGGPEAEHYEQWAVNHIKTERAQSWAIRAFPGQPAHITDTSALNPNNYSPFGGDN